MTEEKKDLEEPLLESKTDEKEDKDAAMSEWEKFWQGRTPSGSKYLKGMSLLILANILIFIFSTEKGFDDWEWAWIKDPLESVTVIIFTIDYIQRFRTAGELEKYKGLNFIACRFKFMTSFFGIVDLLSILPTLADWYNHDDEYIPMQWLRVFRMLNLLPDLPYGQIWTKSKPLFIASGFCGFTTWIICAAFYYLFEHNNEGNYYCIIPEDPTFCYNRFDSIPRSMYYSLLNFFGEFPLIDNYGFYGRFVAGFIQLAGAAVIAIPAGLLGNAFQDLVEEEVGEVEYEDEDDAPVEEQTGPGAVPRQIAKVLDGSKNILYLYIPATGTPIFSVDLAPVFQQMVTILSVASVVHVTLASVGNQPEWKLGHVNELLAFLEILNTCGTFVFAIEWLTRCYAAPYKAKGGSTVSYLKSSYGFIDFLSFSPNVYSMLGLPYGSAVRCLSVFRIAKMERYAKAFSQFDDIIVTKSRVLIITGGAALVAWVFFSTLLFYAERDNPDDSMQMYYTSIPCAMWMTLLNLTGESPVCDYTNAGKLITGFMGLIGVGFTTIPMGVLGAGFQDWLSEEEEEAAKAKAEAPPEEKKPPNPAAEYLAKKQAIQERLLSEGANLSTRQRIFKFLKGSAMNQIDDMDPMEGWAVRFEQLIFTYIFLTCTVAALETVEGYAPEGTSLHSAFKFIELSGVLIFTVEYGLRYFSCPEDPHWPSVGYTTDKSARFAHITSPSSLIDLMAILPFYLAIMGSTIADRYDGELRMLRVFRLLTLDQYIPSVSLIGRVFVKKRHYFNIAGYAALVMWVIFSVLVYLCERHDPFKVDDLRMEQRYGSLLSSLTYMLVHLTGDYPLVDYDFQAKCVLFVSLIAAVGVVSVPAGLVASSWTGELEEFRESQRQKQKEAATVIGKMIKGYIARRRLRKAIKGAIEADKEQKKVEKSSRTANPAMYKCHCFLERKTTAGKMFGNFIMLLIITNVLAVMAESVVWMKKDIGVSTFTVFEIFSVILFSADFIMRLWTAPCNTKFAGKRRNYLFSFFGVVDMMTVVPFWLEFLLSLCDIHFDTFIFRVIRMFRVLQLENFVSAFTLLDDAWYNCRDSMVACGFMALLVWVCGSVAFYEAEKDNPRMEGAFASLPDSMYYSLIFLGGEWGKIDFTPMGHFVCVFYCAFGIAIYSIPIGSVFEAFSDVLESVVEAEDGDGEEGGDK